MKKLLFGLTFFGSMMMTGVSFEAKADMPPPGTGEVYKWMQVTCNDGVSTFEICLLSGDGNLCPTWGEQTRNCPI